MRHEFSDDVMALALLRARNRCEVCKGKAFKDLQFHHVGNPKDNSLFNCQVLCIECHESEHKRRRLLK